LQARELDPRPLNGSLSKFDAPLREEGRGRRFWDIEDMVTHIDPTTENKERKPLI
jgi:hypothetical protein